MRQIRTVIGATTIDPKLLTAAERTQYEGYLRREETNAASLALSTNGIPIKQLYDVVAIAEGNTFWYNRRWYEHTGTSQWARVSLFRKQFS